MSQYQQLAARFDEVRASWKRAAALSGLAIVITEGIGIFTGLLLLDWLYQPRPVVRIGMWGAALAALVWLIIRHVARPLTRSIPDEQIAMYIEEHRNDLDGLLITAAEYGRKREGLVDGKTESRADLVDLIVNEASSRARTAASQTVDFSRLKKYGIGAAAGLGIYVLLGSLFPNAVGHHLGRVLQPWLATAEDSPKRPTGPAPLEPIRFSLTNGDASLARGASVDFEASLSRTAEKPVVLNFRPRAQGDAGAWQHLPMTAIEKLNGYQGSLSDVSEDLEYYVSSGADKSETHHLAVFDPLVVQSMAVTTHYPAYLKLPDRVENPSSGDVEAVIGSTVTVRINTSTPLKEGTIKWDSGQAQPVTIDPQTPAAAEVTYEVKQDATYDYALADTNGQKAASLAPLTVKAIADKPPTVTIKFPQSPVLSNPLGEVHFEIDADDDFGVEGLDLVYSRLDDRQVPQETRIPLTLAPGDTKAAPHAVHATYDLLLENANPPFKPDDAISYHLEARDAKGQKAVSDIGFIISGYYEQWATYVMPTGEHHGQHPDAPDITAILSLVWTLQGEKPTLAPIDFQAQSKEIAGKMVDATGNLLPFVDLMTMPQLAKVAAKINLHANNAYKALLVADTATASAELSIAVTLFVGNSIIQNSDIHTAAGGGAGARYHAPALTMLEQARLQAVSQTSADKANQEQQKQDAAAATATGKQIQDLLKQQDDLIAKAKGQAVGGGGGGAKQQQAAMAQTEKEIAEKTKAAAESAKGSNTQGANAKGSNASGSDAKGSDSKGSSSNGAGTKLQQAAGKAAEAAKAMEDAAAQFAAGNTAAGTEKAAIARKALAEAGETLQDTSRDKLEQAISDAASHAAALLEKQTTLRTAGESMAKELDGGKTPDQRQARDLKQQAYQQTGLHGDAQSLISEIGSLSSWAATVGEPESIQALGEAQKTIKRAQPDAQMASAIIDLTNGAPATAAGEQKAAETALQKIVEDLHNGSDALAASREAQLRRAQRNAEEAKKGLEQIAQLTKPNDAGAQGAQGKQDSVGAQGKQGSAGAQGKQGSAGAQGKQGSAGAQGKQGGAAGAQGTQGGGAAAQAKSGTQAGEQGKQGQTAGAEALSGGGHEEMLQKALLHAEAPRDESR